MYVLVWETETYGCTGMGLKHGCTGMGLKRVRTGMGLKHVRTGMGDSEEQNSPSVRLLLRGINKRRANSIVVGGVEDTRGQRGHVFPWRQLVTMDD